MFTALWHQVNFKDIIDILVVAILIYQFIRIVQGTRALQMVFGMVILALIFWVGLSFKLYSLNWILAHFFDSFFIIVIILFQDQIRTVLASVGTGRRIFGLSQGELRAEIEEVVEAASVLGREKIGGLIVLERNHGLSNYAVTGTKVDAAIHSDLIYAIFQSKSPMHDGAIILSGNRITAAGCFLPLSKNTEIERHLGTRHRAALGVTETSDAVVVVISEESGRISLGLSGELYTVKDEKELRDYLMYIWAHNKLSGYSVPAFKEAP